MSLALYRGRLAPSPTGKLHLGIARTSLVAWLAARAQGGALVLRAEDLDPPRVVAGAEASIMDDLRWLGLDWDEGPDRGGPLGPYRQSERTALYEAALERLARAGHLFPCTCSRAEVLAASSAPHGDLGPRYPGTCRAGVAHPGRPASLRFRMQTGEVWRDRLQGPQAASEPDDFVVRRADGLFAYQLAVVVDDIAMRITEVVRGADLLLATQRQLALYRALGAAAPAFLHVPLVLGPEGARLAKRHAATAIAELRAAGVAPEKVVARLAASLGLAHEGELVRPQDLVERFDVAKLPTEPAVFSPVV